MTLIRRNVPGRARLIDTDPFEDFDRLFREVAAPTSLRSEAAGYPVDLYETDEALVLEMAVPGVDADDLDISVEGRNLTLRVELPEVEAESRRYWLQGIPRGTVSRNVKLPNSVDVEGIEAHVSKGMLTLTMPKAAEAKVKKIAIRSGA